VSIGVFVAQEVTGKIMSTIRAFMAIDLSPEARSVLAQVGENLSQQSSDKAVKCVAPYRLHPSLRLLG
jgi:2'-5' RNA ligase